MKTKIIFILIIITSFSKLFSQNLIFKGSEKFQATESWEFKCDLSAGIGHLDVQIAKKEKGGYLMLSIDSLGNTVFIGDNVYVFLENGNVITCTDKNIKDNVNGKSVVLYNFTNLEIKELEQYNILKFRFTLKPQRYVNGGDRDFTAENTKYFVTFGNTNNKFDTADAIRKLFK